MTTGISTADTLHLLRTGHLELVGLLPWSSNYTFLAKVTGTLGEDPTLLEIEAVYKPRRGERPLWDFASGTLCQRELAAFITSRTLNWQIVPTTILREGPHGLGSVQRFIDHDPERHYLTFEGDPAFRTQLQKIALFDILINNADRKSGHVLVEAEANEDGSDRLWTIDHGICFHTDNKLRTVIWEFAGQPIPDELMSDLATFREAVNEAGSETRSQLAPLLTGPELDALERRADRLLQQGKFYRPGPGRHYPWPPI
jgi:uncharacterized repeat protein (TIGR03843 family)